MKHINTLTWEDDGKIRVRIELFYKERRRVDLLIDKSRFDEIDLEYLANSKNKHIQKLTNETT